ncbi:MAG TPA: ankyrin repeat domain-containing protein [Candidatus Angelobacter sp.]|nr:ankyrin repeat domain-containing protein [Candidatus Angelobacter sp.]
MNNVQSQLSRFEAAVDAIVTGDAPTLRKLLHDDPSLARARSSREHRSTLLHYVSANGVEDVRQKTPGNIVEIATILLETDSDINAESEAYGGHSTTLELAATSYHPEVAGVQLALLELLIKRGAKIDGLDGRSTVNSCLHNGRGPAAEFLAGRGALLDLEGAAGVGRLDLVRSFFETNGVLKPTATQRQMLDGFAWACEFGRTQVVDFFLQRGLRADAKLSHGETGLHWAAFEAHIDVAKLLLANRADVDSIDDTYHGTPLGWALYAWGGSRKSEPYYAMVALLARAGARLESDWLEQSLVQNPAQNQNNDRQRAAEKVRSDPRMQAALRGEAPGAGPSGSVW